MKRVSLFALIVVAFVFTLPSTAAAQAVPTPDQLKVLPNLIRVFRVCSLYSKMVSGYYTGKRFEDGSYQVITTFHLIKNESGNAVMGDCPDTVLVDDMRLPAKVVASDPDKDLLMLSAPLHPERKLVELSFRSSVTAGEKLYQFGHLFYQSNLFSKGEVEAIVNPTTFTVSLLLLPGMSGSPILAAKDNAVVGVVRSYHINPLRHQGIPYTVRAHMASSGECLQEFLETTAKKYPVRSLTSTVAASK